MKHRKQAVGAAGLIAAFILLGGPGTAVASADCDPGLAANIPARPVSASVGSAFVRRLETLDDDEREAAILEELSAGNVPGFLRQLAPITLTGLTGDGREATVTVCVLPDYLAVGSDTDFMLVPMRLDTALTVAHRLGFMLPTRKIVDAVYEQALVHLQPKPLPASDQMRSTAYYWHHAELVHEQRLETGAPPGALTAGDKKDLVITNRLWQYPDRVAIYGWHLAPGHPIQPLSTVHGSRYADYSHGIRLVAMKARLDGAWQALPELLEDSSLAGLVSDEGPLTRLAQLLSALHSEAVRPRADPSAVSRGQPISSGAGRASKSARSRLASFGRSIRQPRLN